MDLESAIKRVKKCLELSRSASEHEAATALRQAQALMRKFNLSADGVLAHDVGEATIKAKYKSKPPSWDWILVHAAASMFGCVVLFEFTPSKGSRWIFIGEGGNAEVASYAYEVLSRQLRRSKAAFMDGLPTGLGVGMKRKLSKGFAEGWVSRVVGMIAKYAGAMQDPPETVKAYVNTHNNNLKKANVRAFKVGDPVKDYAISAGFREGAKAQLHPGVRHGDGPVLLVQ